MPLLAQRATPRIILGLMTLGPEGTGARITSLDEYKKILDYFQSKGYNEVDTARVYCNGEQEAFTTAAGYQERGLTLATKWYPVSHGQHKPDIVTEQANKSLEALKTDCVDIWYLHGPDRGVPFEETLRAVNDLHKQGKFVQLGLSNYTAFEVAEIVMICRQHGWVRPSIFQAMYNAITRSIDPELVVACRRYGLDIVIYNPIAGGIFSGKYKTADVPAEGRFSADAPTGQNYRDRYFKDRTFDALRVIEPVVEKHNLTLIETALRWCVHHSALKVLDGNDGVIIGISSMKQLEENLEALEKGPLPDEVVEALDEAWLIAKPTTPNYWHHELAYSYDTRKALFG